MHSYTIASVCAALLVGLVAGRPEDATYPTKYDNIDLQQVLHNDRLEESIFKCLMDQGKCPPEGAELKKHLPDALETGCAKCTEKQKSGAETTIKYLIEEKPEQWSQLKKKFDPENKWSKKYEEEARKRGIKV